MFPSCPNVCFSLGLNITLHFNYPRVRPLTSINLGGEVLKTVTTFDERGIKHHLPEQLSKPGPFTKGTNSSLSLNKEVIPVLNYITVIFAIMLFFSFIDAFAKKSYMKYTQ